MDSAKGTQRLRTTILIAVVGVALFWMLRTVLTPVFFAFLIAYMLDPIADRFEAWKLPRAVGIVFILTVAAGIVALFLLMVLPGVIRDVAEFFRELPGATRSLMAEWTPVLESYDIPVPHSLSEVFEQLRDDTDGMAQRAVAPAAAVAQWIVGGTANVIGAAAQLLLIPVFAFYLLYDFDRITAATVELVPFRNRRTFVSIAKEVDEVLGQFIRGQLSVMLVLAVLYAVGYSIVGVRLAIPIGIVAGLVAFIPYVGGATALVLALGMTLFDWQGWNPVIGVVVVYAVVQVLEGFVITPAIVGDKVGLSAVWVLFALMAFGDLFGFLGVLLAVPAAAVGKIFVVHAVRRYKSSGFFVDGREAELSGIDDRRLSVPEIATAEGPPDPERCEEPEGSPTESVPEASASEPLAGEEGTETEETDEEEPVTRESEVPPSSTSEEE